MAGDNLQIVPVLADHLGGFLSDKFVAGAVETVATDAVFLVVFVWKAVEERLGRQSAVESGVEHYRLRHAGQHLAHSVDTCQVARGVERSQVLQTLDLLDDFVGHNSAILEDLATMCDTVADGSDLFEVFDDANLGVGQSFENNLYTFGVIGYGQLLIVFLAVEFMGEFTHIKTDSLEKTFCHHLGIVRHIYQLVFDRGATTI